MQSIVQISEKHEVKLFLITSIFFSFAYCTNTRDKLYSFEEANAKILTAFAMKDNACGTVHTITSFIPSEAQKSDVDSCVKVIQALDCATWSTSNPTPVQCTAIQFKRK
ncbi:MAG: hypothetical protein IT215_03690 [Chitinophagaceae bacterium]|nr:hypothetical protein [Chitinophagaceae bacterium]